MFIYVLDYNSEVTGAIKDLHIPITVGILGPFLSCKLNITYVTCPRKQKFLRGKIQINILLNYSFGSSNMRIGSLREIAWLVLSNNCISK